MNWAISQNIAYRHFNITGILNNFKSLVKQVPEKGWTHKFHQKNDQNIYLRVDLSQKYEKLLAVMEKKYIDFQ